MPQLDISHSKPAYGWLGCKPSILTIVSANKEYSTTLCNKSLRTEYGEKRRVLMNLYRKLTAYTKHLSRICSRLVNLRDNMVHCFYNLKEKRKRSDSILWQKPLHPQKTPKSNNDLQSFACNCFPCFLCISFDLCCTRPLINTPFSLYPNILLWSFLNRVPKIVVLFNFRLYVCISLVLMLHTITMFQSNVTENIEKMQPTNWHRFKWHR